MNGILPVVAGSGAEDGLLQVASGRLALEERLAVGHARLEMVPQLGGDEVPQHVVVVVDGRYGDVDLGRPVWLVTSGRTVDELEPFHEVPPQRRSGPPGRGLRRAPARSGTSPAPSG